MLCEQCHKNDATIFLTQVCEGETTKLALCATCGAPFMQRTISPEQLVAWLQSGQSNAPFPFSTFDQVAANHPHYAREAFLFVRDGVHYASQSHARDSRHASAAELLDALRALASRNTARTLESSYALGVLHGVKTSVKSSLLLSSAEFSGKDLKTEKKTLRTAMTWLRLFQLPRRRPNQTPERTATRRVFRFRTTKTFNSAAKLAFARGG